MRLRAIDLPRRGSYVFVVDDLEDHEMDALLQHNADEDLSQKVREWGAEGMLVFPGRVVLDEQVTPSGIAQMRVTLEDAVNVSWTERPDQVWGTGRRGEGMGG